ncbi:hypothetical protein NE237_000721 [Protea cynaroides]|uniref:Uncharacterized protein n=1 Tax=Protea cynaroides TaxID=273540 RepID=A0A9Q0QXR9_9MAGN|nr:hypothetical protein NE237_000721 [Protea cynaroides]
MLAMMKKSRRKMKKWTNQYEEEGKNRAKIRLKPNKDHQDRGLLFQAILFFFPIHHRQAVKHQLFQAASSWKWFLQNQAEAKQRATEKLAAFLLQLQQGWGSADFIFGSLNPIQELGGKGVWFNTILDYTSNEKDMKVVFGDGSVLPSKAAEAFKWVLNKNFIDIKWQKRDVLLLDNF